jgi:crotonobetainyl-CoA:carnitine CoA-transferase CaiB-like acyl-CoA transferase
MHHVGPPDGPPLVIPARIHWDLAGAHAALCVIAALAARERVGGQTIDVSAQEVESAHDFFFERWFVDGARPLPRVVPIGFPPTGTWQCRDGPFDVAAHQAHHWGAFLRMLDNPDELSEPALQDASVRREIFDGIQKVVEKLMAEHSREELFQKGQSVGLPTCLLNTPAQFVRDIQLAERGSFVEMTRPGTGTFTAPGPAVHSTPALFRVRRPAPQLGEHNEEIYRGELGFERGDLVRWRDDGLV